MKQSLLPHPAPPKKTEKLLVGRKVKPTLMAQCPHAVKRSVCLPTWKPKLMKQQITAQHLGDGLGHK